MLWILWVTHAGVSQGLGSESQIWKCAPATRSVLRTVVNTGSLKALPIAPLVWCRAVWWTPCKHYMHRLTACPSLQFAARDAHLQEEKRMSAEDPGGRGQSKGPESHGLTVSRRWSVALLHRVAGVSGDQKEKMKIEVSRRSCWCSWVHVLPLFDLTTARLCHRRRNGRARGGRLTTLSFLCFYFIHFLPMRMCSAVLKL